MSNGPRHDVAIAIHVSVALCGGPQHSGNVTRDRGLLGENSDGPGFPRWVDQSSILAGAWSPLTNRQLLTRSSLPKNHDKERAFSRSRRSSSLSDFGLLTEFRRP